MYRIGLGFDIHKTSEKRELFIGGIKIPSKFGLLGHSDADVLIHSICDAILGALALGDIGEHFSDKDPKNKNKKTIFRFIQGVLVGSAVTIIIFYGLTYKEHQRMHDLLEEHGIEEHQH